MESRHQAFVSLILSGLMLLPGKTAIADTTIAGIEWPDFSSARVEFEVNLMGMIPVSGQFHDVNATRGDAASGADPLMNFSVSVDSVDTRNAPRDRFLRSAAFFDAGRFPAIRVTGRRLVQGADGVTQLLGNLTLHGTTRPVAFALVGKGANGDGKQAGGERLAARTTIERDEFGLDALALAVSNEVEVRVYITEPDRRAGARQLSRAD